MKYIVDNPDIVRDLLLRHLQITAIALAFALAIALPLGPARQPLPLARGAHRRHARHPLHDPQPRADYPAHPRLRAGLETGDHRAHHLRADHPRAEHPRRFAIGQPGDARGGARHGHECAGRCGGASSSRSPCRSCSRACGSRRSSSSVSPPSARSSARAASVGSSSTASPANRYDKIWAGAIAVSALAFVVNGLLLLLERACDPARRAKSPRRQRAMRALQEGAQPIPG